VIVRLLDPVGLVKPLAAAGVAVAAAVLVLAFLGAGPGFLGTHRSGAAPAPKIARFRIGDSEASVRTKLGPPASAKTATANGRRIDSWYYGTLPRHGPYQFVFVNGHLR
jgi:hypothetical protein